MRRALGRMAASATLVAFGLLEAAIGCTYDFDQFTASDAEAGAGGSEAPAAGSPGAGGGALSGRGGAESSGGASAAGGDDAGGLAGELGTGGIPGGEAGAPAGGGSDGGQGGEPPSSGGAADPGGEAGQAGQATGGATGGAPTGGAPTGGAPPSGGMAGASGGTASGGAPSGGNAGSGGAADPCTDRGGTLWNEHCYFVTSAALGWLEARTACEDAEPPAYLVTITSPEEQQMLEDSFFPTPADFWIGLSLADPTMAPPASCETDPPSCPHSWATGEEFATTAWDDGEPNFSGSCVRMRSDSMRWADQDCGTGELALCEEE